MNAEPVIVVTGFEPFGSHTINPSGELAKEMDGRRVGACVVRGAVLPVEHTAATAITTRLLSETDPMAVLQLGLAEGRARIGLERGTQPAVGTEPESGHAGGPVDLRRPSGGDSRACLGYR